VRIGVSGRGAQSAYHQVEPGVDERLAERRAVGWHLPGQGPQVRRDELPSAAGGGDAQRRRSADIAAGVQAGPRDLVNHVLEDA
jgi:hypothetical protein